MDGNLLPKLLASAHRSVERGQRVRAAAEKLLVMFGMLSTFSHFASTVPVVAAGDQSVPPATLQVRPDGRSIVLAGGINNGAASYLDAALQLAPAVTTVVLSSGGGWVSEAELLAEVIRKRGLNTYVEHYCASACTIVFLAGKKRAMAPSAKIGFHSGRVAGSAGIFYVEKNERLRALYQNAGLPDAFVRQALDTPSQNMWYPGHEDMQSAGVLTPKLPGEQTAALSPRDLNMTQRPQW